MSTHSNLIAAALAAVLGGVAAQAQDFVKKLLLNYHKPALLFWMAVFYIQALLLLEQMYAQEINEIAMTKSVSYKKLWDTEIRLCNALTKNDLTELKNIIVENEIKCSISETCNWTDVRQFNLMFSTEFGSVAAEDGEESIVYLRPETAQGIFVNFLNVQKTGRMNVAFWYCTNR